MWASRSPKELSRRKGVARNASFNFPIRRRCWPPSRASRATYSTMQLQRRCVPLQSLKGNQSTAVRVHAVEADQKQVGEGAKGQRTRRSTPHTVAGSAAADWALLHHQEGARYGKVVNKRARYFERVEYAGPSALLPTHACLDASQTSVGSTVCSRNVAEQVSSLADVRGPVTCP